MMACRLPSDELACHGSRIPFFFFEPVSVMRRMYAQGVFLTVTRMRHVPESHSKSLRAWLASRWPVQGVPRLPTPTSSFSTTHIPLWPLHLQVVILTLKLNETARNPIVRPTTSTR